MCSVSVFVQRGGRCGGCTVWTGDREIVPVQVQVSFNRLAIHSKICSATPGWAKVVAVDRACYYICPWNIQSFIAREKAWLVGDGHFRRSEIWWGTAIKNALAGEEVIWAIFLKVDGSTWLLGVTKDKSLPVRQTRGTTPLSREQWQSVC